MSIARGKSHSFLEMKYFVSTFNIYLEHMRELKVRNKIKRTIGPRREKQTVDRTKIPNMTEGIWETKGHMGGGARDFQIR